MQQSTLFSAGAAHLEMPSFDHPSLSVVIHRQAIDIPVRRAGFALPRRHLAGPRADMSLASDDLFVLVAELSFHTSRLPHLAPTLRRCHASNFSCQWILRRGRLICARFRETSLDPEATSVHFHQTLSREGLLRSRVRRLHMSGSFPRRGESPAKCSATVRRHTVRVARCPARKPRARSSPAKPRTRCPAS